MNSNVDEIFLENVKDYDFFDGNAEEFYKRKTADSILVQGSHWDRDPLVTIIILTYKRPELLEQALQSALQQIGFDDYQILIVDNEGADIEIKTETAELVSRYKDDKVIYYRHIKQQAFKADTAVMLARSKWICFLHDDDFLVKNHLAVMSKIILENKKIEYLACTVQPFSDFVKDETFCRLTDTVNEKFKVVHFPKKFSCTGYVPGWLGALIEREKYIAMGGMPSLSSGIGDFIMQGKYIYKWGGVYQCRNEKGLYCYRQWTGQDSSLGNEFWLKGYMTEYFYYKYLVDKYSTIFRSFWIRIGAYEVIRKCRDKEQSFYNLNVDLKRLMEICNMPKDTEKKDWKFKLCMKALAVYKLCIIKIWNIKN